MRIRAKFWLESDQGEFLLGPGTLRLLGAVAEKGSLKAAARSLRLGYRTAWARLRRAEAGLGFPLLQRHSGGEGGGGSILTPEAWALLEGYQRFLEGLEEELEARFCAAFGGRPGQVRR
ncbi:LysR family transcriptional regulator [Meiothermus sp. QL-1]|uniref:winged helix-turn-helix domain-containing protein n=1 Tax=Meiothermus sp. QL-1 TaxID=2058095 RepID=UPI000E0C45D3|nr:LysR family transcriptional regulator [Meiothermus sp. QL-1]RDI96664.1 LysR family transcriptional regulator [Meiothermus sp. QL-1]